MPACLVTDDGLAHAIDCTEVNPMLPWVGKRDEVPPDVDRADCEACPPDW